MSAQIGTDIARLIASCSRLNTREARLADERWANTKVMSCERHDADNPGAVILHRNDGNSQPVTVCMDSMTCSCATFRNEVAPKRAELLSNVTDANVIAMAYPFCRHIYIVWEIMVKNPEAFLPNHEEDDEPEYDNSGVFTWEDGVKM